MKPSSLVKSIQDRLNLLLANYEIKSDNSSWSEKYLASVRRTICLSWFNIVKLDSLLFEELSDLAQQVPLELWPLMNLPSSKLEGLLELVNSFLGYNFNYKELFYSQLLWSPIFQFLFKDNLISTSEYPLSNFEEKYNMYRVDYAILMKEKLWAPPLLLVELARDHLIYSNHSHKDEDKITLEMGASLLKIIGLNWSNNREFLEKLKVYGILGGATDFDLCQIYAVFPNEDKSDFYMVFQGSTTKLRFSILEMNSYDSLFGEERRRVSGQTAHQPRAYQPTGFEGNASPVIRNIADAREEILIGSQIETRSAAPVASESGKKTFCEQMFKNGYVNKKALQILEKVAQLVEEQAELLTDMKESNDPGFDFDDSLISKMSSGRSSHTHSSPFKTRQDRVANPNAVHVAPLNIRNEPAIPPPVTNSDISDLLQQISRDKENIASDNIDYNRNDLPDKKMEERKISASVRVTKQRSKYELEIYQNPIIKSSKFFPVCLSYNILNDKEHQIELEEIRPLYDFQFSDFRGNMIDTFFVKMLVDVMGALRALHSAGYVHGDVTPGNIGFNGRLGIWQLFDFDNSRTIEDAELGIGDYYGTKGYTSVRFTKTGKYFPQDDYIGLINTCLRFSAHSIIKDILRYDFEEDLREIVHALTKSNLDLTKEQLEWVYLRVVQIFWNHCADPCDASIANAVDVITKIVK